MRISATIRRDLAEALDDAGKNRSALLESIVETWLEEARRHELDLETARYYRSYADVESQEERAWVGRASAGLMREPDEGGDA